MVSREQCETILEYAAQAPSGDNAQPWRFEIKDGAIDVYNVPGKDYSPYNYEERGSYFAHGAMIENAAQRAAALGYRTLCDLFPGKSADHVAHLAFEPLSGGANAGGAASGLAAQVLHRTTNRKPYKKVPLEAAHKDALMAAVRDAGWGELRMIEARETIAELAKTLSLSDQLIFEDKKIHDAIFAAIRWTEREEAEKPGLFIKTLELPPPARALFRALRDWKLLTRLNRIGISKFIASQSAKNYAASSAFGMLVIPDAAHESFVRAGRTFERAWLTAASLGLALQPTTALPYLASRVAAGAAESMSEPHKTQIADAHRNILRMFGDPQGTVAMVFRVGYGPKPSAHSRKEKPDALYR